MSIDDRLPATPFPHYSHRERVADLCFHVVGLTLGLVGVALLPIVCGPGRWSDGLGLGLYAAGLLTMLSFSACYNMSRDHRRKEIFRRFDRAAIFLMIAGSYSPFALAKMGGAQGLGLFALVWGIAILGASITFAFPRSSDRIGLCLYLAAGWSVLLALEPLTAAFSGRVITLLLVGGVVYTAGIALLVARRLPYHNALWHACVLAAAGCHYVAVVDAFASIAA